MSGIFYVGQRSVSKFEFEFSKVQRPTRHIIGHFGDESSQAINYTGTDNEKVTKACTHKLKKITQKHALYNNEK